MKMCQAEKEKLSSMLSDKYPACVILKEKKKVLHPDVSQRAQLPVY